MNVNVLLACIGMGKCVLLASEEKSLTLKKIYANVLLAQDGMVSVVLLNRFVRMVKNGMCLNLCVNVQIIVFGMELIV